MDCYIENLDSAFLDHCRRTNQVPLQALTTTDMFALHTPFRNMPEIAMKHLLQQYLGLANGQTEAFLESKGFYGGIDPIANLGNTYSSSLYVSLAYLLKEQYTKYGEDIVGKKILFASYGSGNTMIVFSGKIAKSAPEVIRKWDLPKTLTSGEELSLLDYNLWMNGPYDADTYNDLMEHCNIPSGKFYLSQIRKDGYREYEFTKEAINRVAEGETSSYMREPLSILD
jgi:hydroxymethylglutaryl-CoA synthase